MTGTPSSSRGGGGEAEIEYAEITANVTVDQTSAAAATTVVSLAARVYDGSTTVMLEFFCGDVLVGSGTTAAVVLNLWDDATNIGRWGLIENVAANTGEFPVLLRRRLTPSAASHTYIVKAWRVAANGTIIAGAGGVDVSLPAYLRATEVTAA